MKRINNNAANATDGMFPILDENINSSFQSYEFDQNQKRFMEKTNYTAKILHKKTLGKINSDMMSNIDPKSIVKINEGFQSNISPRTSESVLYPSFDYLKANQNMVNKSLDF